MAWQWRLPQPLKTELGISETELATRAAIRRPTVSALRGQRDTFTSVLVALYLAAREVKPDVTLHDFIAVDGAPANVIVRRYAPQPDMAPLPDLPGVYLATPLLRKRFALTPGAPTTARALARASDLDETALSRMEHGHLQPKVSTFIRLYLALLPFDAMLTLHDVLIIPLAVGQTQPLTGDDLAPLLAAAETALQHLRAASAAPTQPAAPDGRWQIDPAATRLLERVQRIVALVAERGGLEYAPGCFGEGLRAEG